ncbi:MAG TPA: FAD binding domain-containing protein [Stellaceae bacterium]|nr:FAD binding domain-containing protein [Stellaceae bacterium]
MDLAGISDVLRPTARDELPPWRPGDAWLGGGTWLFSELQPALSRLIALDGFGWEPLARNAHGLTIAATCSVAALRGFAVPPEWPAAALFRPCCEALQSSFKIWNTATVGGNLCLSLPAGSLIALAVALESECLIWRPNGGEHRIEAADFVTGINRNKLGAGELLRAVEIPTAALARRSAFRHVTAHRFGRTLALVIGTHDRSDDRFALTVGAATQRPLRLSFPAFPGAAELGTAIEAAVPDALCVDDAFATPRHRRRLALALAEEVRRELAQGSNECR